MNTLNLHLKSLAESPSLEVPTANAASAEPRTYHELPGLRHETRDVLKTLESNIRLLEDVGGRLSFVLSEVSTLIRR